MFDSFLAGHAGPPYWPRSWGRVICAEQHVSWNVLKLGLFGAFHSQPAKHCSWQQELGMLQELRVPNGDAQDIADKFGTAEVSVDITRKEYLPSSACAWSLERNGGMPISWWEALATAVLPRCFNRRLMRCVQSLAALLRPICLALRLWIVAWACTIPWLRPQDFWLEICSKVPPGFRWSLEELTEAPEKIAPIQKCKVSKVWRARSEANHGEQASVPWRGSDYYINWQAGWIQKKTGERLAAMDWVLQVCMWIPWEVKKYVQNCLQSVSKFDVCVCACRAVVPGFCYRCRRSGSNIRQHKLHRASTMEPKFSRSLSRHVSSSSITIPSP